MPEPLSGSQRKYLRGLAHGLKPVVHIGSAGLGPAVLENIDQALERHQLIKIRFVEHKERKRELCSRIEEALGCQVAGVVGHVAVVFRAASDPKERLHLPD